MFSSTDDPDTYQEVAKLEELRKAMDLEMEIHLENLFCIFLYLSPIIYLSFFFILSMTDICLMFFLILTNNKYFFGVCYILL